MGIRVGTGHFGRVKEVDGQYIATTFFYVGGPLLPTGSHFVIESAQKQFDLPLQPQSIALGYLRTWTILPLLASIIDLFVAFTDKRSLAQDFITDLGADPGPLGAKILSVVVILAMLAWTWFSNRRLGLPTPEEQRRRENLGLAVGINADPSLLPEQIRKTLLSDLHQTWKKVRKLETLPAWKKVEISTLSLAALPFFYSLCRYEAVENGDEQASSWAEEAIARLMASEIDEGLEGKAPLSLAVDESDDAEDAIPSSLRASGALHQSAARESLETPLTKRLSEGGRSRIYAMMIYLVHRSEGLDPAERAVLDEHHEILGLSPELAAKIEARALEGRGLGIGKQKLERKALLKALIAIAAAKQGLNDPAGPRLSKIAERMGISEIKLRTRVTEAITPAT